MKHWIVSIKIKVLIKFGVSEMMCVRAKKLRNVYTFNAKLKSHAFVMIDLELTDWSYAISH